MKNLEGQKAPTFSLEGNDGKKHSLEDYRGKIVVLYFYPRDDTPGLHQGDVRVQGPRNVTQKIGSRGLGSQQRQYRIA
jgi:peroxiredoxin